MECAPILMPCMVFILCVYIYLQTILEKCSHILFIGNLSPGKVSPCIFYWQSCPQAKCPHAFLLAICPHAFFIGKVSPCIFYWQSVPMNFLSFGIFSIVKHSSHTALGIFFLFSLFFSPFSFLLFLCLFFLFLLQARHGRFRGFSSSGQLSSPLRLRAHLCTKVLKMCQ